MSILCVWVFCLCVCTYTTCIPGTWRSQKSASYPLKIELQVFVSHHVGVGNHFGSSAWRESSHLVNYLSSPKQWPFLQMWCQSQILIGLWLEHFFFSVTVLPTTLNVLRTSWRESYFVGMPLKYWIDKA